MLDNETSYMINGILFDKQQTNNFKGNSDLIKNFGSI